MSTTTAIDKLSEAEHLLAACRTIDEAQAGIALAESARYHALRVKAGTRMENFATSIKVKYEIRLAELVDEGQATGQILSHGQRADLRAPNDTAVTLAELGIDAPRLLEARHIAAAFTSADIDAIVDAANAEDASISRRALIIAANRARAGAEAPNGRASSAPAEPKSDITAAERQRRHRLRERMKPLLPLPDQANPLEVGSNLLQLVDVLVASPPMHPNVAARELDRLREGIKQLAWLVGE